VIADIAVQFATVFLGAYLAFAAEELRQRRQIREWAKTHLRQLSSLFHTETGVADVATDLLGDQLAALDAWLAARTPDEVTEAQWEAVMHIVSARGPDMSSLLRGEPVALLPPELALALSRVEGIGRELEAANDGISSMRERVMPLWAERRAPLDEAGGRIVAFHRSTVVEYRELIERTVQAVRSAVVQIDAWAGVPG
jgi:hypothetical protein